jgi:hypothetical protein
MAFAGVEPLTAKIIADGKITEHVSDFKYLDCEIPCSNKRHGIYVFCGIV